MPKLSLAKLERHLYSAADRLRQEGLDAATYKDYIFGMLFLKRCSDVFEEEREKIVARKVQQGVALEVAEREYGENPDFYDTFFIPERARWSKLIEKLSDADVVYGQVLDTALGAISDANESLQHVLDHIEFMRTQGNKRVVSDDACKALVRHFTAYRLRNEDFQFSDLLGAAYEFLINMFAESAGKKGGDFYTPRDVIRLMVRILSPTPGMKVYDPTCGSGGMLIITREFIEQSGGDPTNLRLCGQVNDASAWSICKLNMLLHGIRGADIRLEDTLLHPQHKEGGELERFDRVIANPPFSQNYSKSNMEFTERFRWGWCPTTGKKGDLMFAQHMLAVCHPRGMVATVMPHGVLFRGGAEKEIRKKFLDQDLIEAVISLPQNLFYGAGIPACILVMRPNLTGQSPNPNKPPERQGRVLFINADAEFHAGRAQNYLRPEHIEKIASTFERYEDVTHPNGSQYSRSVSLAEISDPANDYNLNIRRYVDNSPPLEPHDVRAHLIGGIPTAEIESFADEFAALAFDPAHAFVARNGDGRYHDFAPAITERVALRQLVENDAGVLDKMQSVRDALAAWWNEHAVRLAELPQRRDLNAVRREFLESFTAALLPLGVLDRFQLAGVLAAWWTETLPDFKTLLENGFAGVIEGWIDAIADALEDDDNVGPAFDPFSHKLVLRTMADYLQQIEDAKAEIARLKGEKEAFEQKNPPDDAEEEELANWNYARDLEQRIASLRAEIREVLSPVRELRQGVTNRGRQITAAQRGITQLNGTGPKSIARAKKKGEATEELEALLCQKQAEVVTLTGEMESFQQRISDLEASTASQNDHIARIEEELAPYERIKADLTVARAHYRELTRAFIDELKRRCDALSAEEKQALVLELFSSDVRAGLDADMIEKRHGVVHRAENLWDKYHVSFMSLGSNRTVGESGLMKLLRELSYA